MEIGEPLKLQLKQNRYHPETDTLIFTEAEAASYRIQAGEWRDYFNGSHARAGASRQLHPGRRANSSA